MLGVGGTSESGRMKLKAANPGVCILNPGGFLLPVLMVSRRGELSVDRLLMPSAAEDVEGLISSVGVGLRDRFFMFREVSLANSGCDVTLGISD